MLNEGERSCDEFECGNTGGKGGMLDGQITSTCADGARRSMHNP
jgi:hypothetical protein